MNDIPPDAPARPPIEAWFWAIMDSLVSCTAITDHSGIILAVNDPWKSFSEENPFIAGVTVGSDFGELCRNLVNSSEGRLSIVHSVVTMHGGTVEFETETGKGTCFIVKLPTCGLAPAQPS